MTIGFVISSNYILHYNRVSVFYASWDALPVDFIFIEENIRLTICICGVNHHMRNLHAELGK